MLAVRNNETPVIVELKLSLNLSVILQAVNRLALAPTVYVGIPRSCSMLKKQRKAVIKLFRMLGLGLITIDPNARSNPVKVLQDPGTYKPKQSAWRQQRLLAEFEKRVGDPNAGGSEMRYGIVTAYRQRAVKIAGYLETNGSVKASILASAIDEPKARDILYRNVYGWFEQEGRGVYSLSPRGQRELKLYQE